MRNSDNKSVFCALYYLLMAKRKKKEKKIVKTVKRLSYMHEQKVSIRQEKNTENKY